MRIQLMRTCSRLPALTHARSHHSTGGLSCQLNRGLRKRLVSSQRYLAQHHLPHALIAVCSSMSAAVAYAALDTASDAAVPADPSADVTTSTPRSKQVWTPEALAQRHSNQGALLFDVQTLTHCRLLPNARLNSCRR